MLVQVPPPEIRVVSCLLKTFELLDFTQPGMAPYAGQDCMEVVLNIIGTYNNECCIDVCVCVCVCVQGHICRARKP